MMVKFSAAKMVAGTWQCMAHVQPPWRFAPQLVKELGWFSGSACSCNMIGC